MLKQKWLSIQEANSLYLYSLANVPDAILKDNHIKPFTAWERATLQRYLHESIKKKHYIIIPRDIIKDFAHITGNSMDLVSVYYRNVNRNHRLLNNFRSYLISKFRLLELTRQSTDKNVNINVRLYSLILTTNPENYHIIKYGKQQCIVDSSGRIGSYKNWARAIKAFKNNYLKRKNTYVLGSMPHCKPNPVSLLEIHAHIDLFSFNKLDIEKASTKIAKYFTKHMGFRINAHLKPINNVLTGKPVIFDKSNYDEPLHLLTAHDANYYPKPSSKNSKNKDKRNEVGNNYDSTQDDINKSGSDSDNVSIPDAPSKPTKHNNHDKSAKHMAYSDIDVIKSMPLKCLTDYVLATMNSSYKVTRRFIFSFKNTKIYRNLKKDIGTLLLPQIILSKPTISTTKSNQRALKALNIRHTRFFISTFLIMQNDDVINEAESFIISCTSTSYLSQLKLDFKYIFLIHQNIITRLRIIAAYQRLKYAKSANLTAKYNNQLIIHKHTNLTDTSHNTYTTTIIIMLDLMRFSGIPPPLWIRVRKKAD